jgi:hypothetical protein
MSENKTVHSPTKLEQLIENFVFGHRALVMAIVVVCIA